LVVAAKMAIEDFGAAAKGLAATVPCEDHRNNPDFAAEQARNGTKGAESMPFSTFNQGTGRKIYEVEGICEISLTEDRA
jgi:hypothetical protein